MARKPRRLSDEAAATLRLFLDDPKREFFGLEIIRAAGIHSGSLYPILHRLDGQGLLTARWEPLDVATAAGRRPRRQYRLHPGGEQRAQALYDEWTAAQGRTHTAPRRSRMAPAT
jgi:PadR family transcriptional regulator PadR